MNIYPTVDHHHRQKSSEDVHYSIRATPPNSTPLQEYSHHPRNYQQQPNTTTTTITPPITTYPTTPLYQIGTSFTTSGTSTSTSYEDDPLSYPPSSSDRTPLRSRVQNPFSFAMEEIYHRDEKMSMILFIVGFILPFLWLLNGVRYRNSSSIKARNYSRYSLVAFAFFFVLFLFAFGTLIVFKVMAVVKNWV